MKWLIKTRNVKENFTDNLFHNTLRPFYVYQFFLSPQVKQCTIITFKHGIYVTRIYNSTSR